MPSRSLAWRDVLAGGVHKRLAGSLKEAHTSITRTYEHEVIHSYGYSTAGRKAAGGIIIRRLFWMVWAGSVDLHSPYK